MPQMAPLSWLSLMMLFITILVMFNVTNFFSFPYQIKQTPAKIKTPQINWKW
uniref:ATP synthase F0 subunit 8 n=1 Tax=Strongylium pinfaense TaxID=2969968 RepID=UPI002176CC1F|nr:ATP synthase F0 subunit 8 [Strongylium pinfaense]UUL71603.1 ATP synthase F0 subunit 8 [Strongylium pinfaense]